MVRLRQIHLLFHIKYRAMQPGLTSLKTLNRDDLGRDYRNKRTIGLLIDCKTVRIFAYSSTHEQSNKRSGMRLKTESEAGERR